MTPQASNDEDSGETESISMYHDRIAVSLLHGSGRSGLSTSMSMPLLRYIDESSSNSGADGHHHHHHHHHVALPHDSAMPSTSSTPVSRSDDGALPYSPRSERSINPVAGDRCCTITDDGRHADIVELSTTSALRKHLRRVHKISIEKLPPGPAPKQCKTPQQRRVEESRRQRSYYSLNKAAINEKRRMSRQMRRDRAFGATPTS